MQSSLSALAHCTTVVLLWPLAAQLGKGRHCWHSEERVAKILGDIFKIGRQNDSGLAGENAAMSQSKIH